MKKYLPLIGIILSISLITTFVALYAFSLGDIKQLREENNDLLSRIEYLANTNKMLKELQYNNNSKNKNSENTPYVPLSSDEMEEYGYIDIHKADLKKLDLSGKEYKSSREIVDITANTSWYGEPYYSITYVIESKTNKNVDYMRVPTKDCIVNRSSYYGIPTVIEYVIEGVGISDIYAGSRRFYEIQLPPDTYISEGYQIPPYNSQSIQD